MPNLTREGYTCPACGRTSHNPNDRENGYCGNCHAFTGNKPEYLESLPQLNAYELRTLYNAIDSALTRTGPHAAVLNGLRTAVGEALMGLRTRVLAASDLTLLPPYSPRLSGKQDGIDKQP